ncbi:hypothetical protein [Streptosporangium pseudovulgare]|uniref:Aldose epimerase n=1 Tax=Streptosporangium pseudovulgare TaxID=35765 RepID=A0ABQ2R5M1_9ACTN|nr:hypothetical protein [Streptosporangium pseudovulgare]GGQ10233.1 hypothetical protein GCM10010140_45730 [Streptosporangium pseudovulgare]
MVSVLGDPGGFRVAVDVRRGGRWDSLTGPDGREWLWSRPDPRRVAVTPGAAFVDVGGVEECFPTVVGEPDHGEVWALPWTGDAGEAAVETGEYRLSRRITAGERITVDYELRAEPGYAFVWAFHALLVPEPGLRVEVPHGHPARVWPYGGPGPLSGRWPGPAGTGRFDVLGPDDGGAAFCLLPGLASLRVTAGAASLRFGLESEHGPVGFGVWRNLGGYAWDGGPPYRSFGVEPMLGAVHDRSKAADGETAVVPASGRTTWRVVVEHG